MVLLALVVGEGKLLHPLEQFPPDQYPADFAGSGTGLVMQQALELDEFTVYFCSETACRLDFEQV
jgi:hypothetical protein